MFFPPRSRSRFYGRDKNYFSVAKSALLGRIRAGSEIDDVERALSQKLGTRYAILMPQARVGIYLTLRELTRTKKKVVLSPYTIHDVINMVLCAGAQPVFADIERKTCNIAYDEIEKLIDDETGAVMVTHLHGLACDIEPIAALCQSRGVPLLEDTSQSFGARVNGKYAGSFGDAGIFSFGMAKNVNCLCGGLVATDRPDLAQSLRTALAELPYQDTSMLLKRASFCLTGDILTWPPVFRAATYWAFRYGYLNEVEALNKRVRGEDAPTIKREIPENYLRRMTPMQARLLIPQLDEVDRLSARRVEYARMYDAGLRDISEILLPPLREDGSHIYLNYAIQVADRHALLRFLMTRGRDLTVQHMGNNADYECYSAYHRDCPNARKTAREVLLLPCYPDYGAGEVKKNIALIREYFKAEKNRLDSQQSDRSERTLSAAAR
jgi:dTDP-4-amino-4,6-dideoxygalactose transaminase